MHFISFFHVSFDHWVELIATVAGLLCVYLGARESLWNFFFGVINAGSFFLLFHDKKLYADMTLHLIYVGFQLYGFYEWRFGGKRHHGVKVVRATLKQWCYLVLAIVVLALMQFYVLTNFTTSTSIPLDSLTTAMSLVASWMLARKWIDNWWLWMAMDALAVVMMFHKGLYLSMGLYFLYTILCVYGYLRWKEDLV